MQNILFPSVKMKHFSIFQIISLFSPNYLAIQKSPNNSIFQSSSLVIQHSGEPENGSPKNYNKYLMLMPKLLPITFSKSREVYSMHTLSPIPYTAAPACTDSSEPPWRVSCM